MIQCAVLSAMATLAEVQQQENFFCVQVTQVWRIIKIKTTPFDGSCYNMLDLPFLDFGYPEKLDILLTECYFKRMPVGHSKMSFLNPISQNRV